MDHPYFKIHTLLQLENIVKYVLRETEQLLEQAKGKMNIEAAEKRHAMMRRIVSNLYMCCVKAGQREDADRILRGQDSKALEAYRRNGPVSGLTSR